MEWEKSMKYEGRMMKWSLMSGNFSSFIIHNSSLWHAPVARLLEEAHTKARSHEEEKGKTDSPLLNYFVPSRLRVRPPPSATAFSASPAEATLQRSCGRKTTAFR
jgi:hypothetical protein